MTEKSKSVSLVEVFRSIQGEGYNGGRDAVFVRFAGCNLACAFAEDALCDTPYQNAKIKTTVEDLFAEILPELISREDLQTRDSGHAPMLVLTGGEPTRAPAFNDVIFHARAANFYVAIETNGTTWRDGLAFADYVSVAPKESVAQESPAPTHNPNPGDPTLDSTVVQHLALRSAAGRFVFRGEYRHVIGGPDDELPPYRPAFRHYLSPAVVSDGSGELWKDGFPGFAPGASDRALALVRKDPRYRLSIQSHKLLGVR